MLKYNIKMDLGEVGCEFIFSIAGVLDFVHRKKISNRTHRFGNWNCFRLQVKKWGVY
jgi:hypothetical protein